MWDARELDALESEVGDRVTDAIDAENQTERKDYAHAVIRADAALAQTIARGREFEKTYGPVLQRAREADARLREAGEEFRETRLPEGEGLSFLEHVEIDAAVARTKYYAARGEAEREGALWAPGTSARLSPAQLSHSAPCWPCWWAWSC
jgi:hypothetical protein